MRKKYERITYRDIRDFNGWDRRPYGLHVRDLLVRSLASAGLFYWTILCRIGVRNHVVNLAVLS